MGTFHTSCTISHIVTSCTILHIVERDRSAVVSSLLVDTGSEYTWVPGSLLESLGVAREKKDQAFVMANGQQITRSLGFAIIRVGSYFTIDEVVFAEPGDLELLGARTLEGLNLMVDPQRKTLVAAGPVPAAGA